MAEKYLSLEKLEVYKLSRGLSQSAWKVYGGLSWQEKKTAGDQFIEATDSVGANIAEGYGRFHYLDKTKFYYNARGSLLEARHWLNLLVEREKVGAGDREQFLAVYSELRPRLNGLINSTLKAKNQKHRG
jgi:four helix bundle protein